VPLQRLPCLASDLHCVAADLFALTSRLPRQNLYPNPKIRTAPSCHRPPPPPFTDPTLTTWITPHRLPWPLRAVSLRPSPRFQDSCPASTLASRWPFPPSCAPCEHMVHHPPQCIPAADAPNAVLSHLEPHWPLHGRACVRISRPFQLTVPVKAP
jgi:hypothetical protein